MVHMANCGPNTTGRMFFNIDAQVGKGGPPQRRNVDTELVQWMLTQLDFLDMNNSFSGENDQKTIDAITQFQLANGPFPPDGFVSVARGVSFGPNHSPFVIVNLNRDIRRKFSGQWPIINQIVGRNMPPTLAIRIGDLLGNLSDTF
jgi:Putative peptidoglycan binding domain